MKIGITIEPFKGMGFEDLMMMLKLLGLDHIEINQMIVPKIEQVIDNIGNMTSTFHLPIYNRFKFDFSTTLKKHDEQMIELLNLINEKRHQLNLKYILSHPPEGPESSAEKLIERLDQFRTPIVIENIIGQKDEEFMEFYFQAKDYLGRKLAGFAIDAPHRYVTDWKNWLNIPDALVKEITYVHISDCSKESDLHLPLGVGEMPFNEFFNYLKEIRYNGIILQELIPSIDHATDVLDSILHSLKPFEKRRYLKKKIKYSMLKPLLQLRINMFSRQLRRNGYGVIPRDLAYELGYN